MNEQQADRIIQLLERIEAKLSGPITVSNNHNETKLVLPEGTQLSVVGNIAHAEPAKRQGGPR